MPKQDFSGRFILISNSWCILFRNGGAPCTTFHWTGTPRSLRRWRATIALVCENGHEVNSCSRSYPKHNAKHCAKCGAKAVDVCPDCSSPIRGRYFAPGIVDMTEFDVPAFCHECNTSYPWTKSKLEAAEELVRLNDQLDQAEKNQLVEAIGEATRDTPKGKVAAEKIKLYGKKMGDAAYKVFLDVFTDVASEYTKKTLGL